MKEGERLPPTILVVFGITGDLSRRYLLPALSQICADGHLSDNFQVLGLSRRQLSLDDVLDKRFKSLRPHTRMLSVDPGHPADFQALKQTIEEIDDTKYDGKAQVIFYLVVPPQATLPIIKNLGDAGLNYPLTKLLLEKPFGTDLDSAARLIKEIDKHFPEKQVFRIDHYLAKESAQNVAVFLGSNSLFRNVWDNRFIDRIDITAAEEIGIEGRDLFWESTGTLRDFVQSHLLQLAALTLMEPCPHTFDFAQLPERRLAALQKMSVASPKKAIRGQYIGYRDEVGKSTTAIETFVALEIKSSDRRWEGVPIMLSTGKRLNQKLTEIDIRFKKTQEAEANLLALRLHPREGIELDLWVKEPGFDHHLQKQPLKFLYKNRFGRVPDAYEQVLIDAMRAKKSLFASSDEVLASWKILQPLIDFWQKSAEDLRIYQPGSTIEEILSVK
jgi:glucose-6-phosphate 1-dehydrogenase